MPVENEFKYVLDPVPELERLVAALARRRLKLCQAYLAPGSRIRSSLSDDGSSREYVFTYKQRVGLDVIEIETAIERADFDRLWASSAERLEKLRYLVPQGADCWELDFFHHGARVYFAQAEIEVAAGVRQAPAVPAFLVPYVVHVVEQGDRRFSSRSLRQVEQAERLLDGLRQRRRAA